jgi:hypothetical protein
MTEEQLQEIRECVERGFPATRSYVERLATALLAHVDALGRELEKARAYAPGMTDLMVSPEAIAAVEFPDTTTVTDAMVERAARGMFEGAWTELQWEESQLREMYRISARRALTAALGGDREGGRG